MDSQDLGQQILSLRKNQDMSQGELATTAGVSRNYISLIERGEAHNISLKIISQLAVALDTTPTGLMNQSIPQALSIPPSLREFGMEDGLSFEAVDKLANIPRRGKEPQTAAEWRDLHEAIRSYLEKT